MARVLGEREDELIHTVAHILVSLKFDLGSRATTMRINAGQKSPEENGRAGGRAEEEGREEISTEATESEQKASRGHRPPKSILKKKKGHNTWYQEEIPLET